MRGSFDLNNEHSFSHFLKAMGDRGYGAGDPHTYGLIYFSRMFENTPAKKIFLGVGVEDEALGINEETYADFVLQAVNEVVLPGETKIETGDRFRKAIKQKKEEIIEKMNQLLDAAREQARINRDDGDAVEKPDGPEEEEEEEEAYFGGGKRRRRSKRRRRRPSTKKRVTRKSRRSKTRRSKSRRRSKRRSRRN